MIKVIYGRLIAGIVCPNELVVRYQKRIFYLRVPSILEKDFVKVNVLVVIVYLLVEDIKKGKDLYVLFINEIVALYLVGFEIIVEVRL